jgi:phenylpropionate dioxygenase-like ring-hydroxylating dioxygenase large terminal subunit
MLENAGECYHCTLVHGELHKTAPTRNTVRPPLGYSSSAFVTRVRNTDIDTDFNPTGKVLLPPIPTLDLEDRRHSTWAILPPNLFLSLQHDNVHYFLVVPKGPNSTKMEVGYLYPESTLERPDFADQYSASLNAWTPIMDQDADVNRRVARGLSSRFVTRGRFSWQEEALAAFGRWLAGRYLAHADEVR